MIVLRVARLSWNALELIILKLWQMSSANCRCLSRICSLRNYFKLNSNRSLLFYASIVMKIWIPTMNVILPSSWQRKSEPRYTDKYQTLQTSSAVCAFLTFLQPSFWFWICRIISVLYVHATVACSIVCLEFRCVVCFHYTKCLGRLT
jgi:hypothetical protein